MAVLSLNNNEFQFEVDLGPIKDVLVSKVTALLEGSGDVSPFSKEGILRGAVKEACKIAMPMVGIEKKDRNDDPVQLMVAHLIELGMNALETQGLALVAKKLDAVLPEPQAPEAPSEAALEAAPEAAPEAALAPETAPAQTETPVQEVATDANNA